jgi:hypothetical protein
VRLIYCVVLSRMGRGVPEFTFNFA